MRACRPFKMTAGGREEFSRQRAFSCRAWDLPERCWEKWLEAVDGYWGRRYSCCGPRLGQKVDGAMGIDGGIVGDNGNPRRHHCIRPQAKVA